nr:MAG TPA: hypothetical protein [Caudoviricetes sp.]
MIILTALIVLALYGLNRCADVLIAQQRAKYVMQRTARSTASRARKTPNEIDALQAQTRADIAYVKAITAEATQRYRRAEQLQHDADACIPSEHKQAYIDSLYAASHKERIVSTRMYAQAARLRTTITKRQAIINEYNSYNSPR